MDWADEEAERLYRKYEHRLRFTNFEEKLAAVLRRARADALREAEAEKDSAVVAALRDAHAAALDRLAGAIEALKARGAFALQWYEAAGGWQWGCQTADGYTGFGATVAEAAEEALKAADGGAGG